MYAHILFYGIFQTAIEQKSVIYWKLRNHSWIEEQAIAYGFSFSIQRGCEEKCQRLNRPVCGIVVFLYCLLGGGTNSLSILIPVLK